MLKQTILVAFASVMLSTVGYAQGKSAPSPQQGSPGLSGSSTVREAPVGHRQPRRGDVPSITENPDAAQSAQDKALDRKIKGICRGC